MHYNPRLTVIHFCTGAFTAPMLNFVTMAIRFWLAASAAFCINTIGALAAPSAVLLLGTVKDATEGAKVYLFRPNSFGQKKIDSTTLKGGAFAFAKPESFVRGLYGIGLAPNQSFETILGSEPVKATLTHPAWSDAQITGSKEKALLERFRDQQAKLERVFADIQGQYNARAKEGVGNIVEQQKHFGNARRRQDSAYMAQDAFYTKMAKENPGTFMGKIATFMAAGINEQERTYVRDSDLKDPELLEGTFMHAKLNTWLQRFVPMDLEKWQAATMELIERAPAASRGREVLYGDITRIFLQFDMDFARKLVTNWLKEFPDSRLANMVKGQLPAAAPEVGDIAPEITLNDSTGKPVSLSSLRGKYVLIDFWASWCGPCRAENPSVVKTYAQYKDKGFTVYSVSLDNARDRWLSAIKKDNLTWPNHVSDLKGWACEGAKPYRVNSIPATFLIDKQGKIAAKNLRGDKLEKFLATVL